MLALALQRLHELFICLPFGLVWFFFQIHVILSFTINSTGLGGGEGRGVVWLVGFFGCLGLFFAHTEILKKPNVMKLEYCPIYFQEYQ